MAVEVDLFPASDFDGWASTYDQCVLDETHFPFIGYQKSLMEILRLAEPQPGMRVLDIGTGTANLAALFIKQGCYVWGTDFSATMLEQAQRKLPQAKYILADIRHGWPPELPPVFERIVSAYVFHHFSLADKVRLSVELVAHLVPQCKLIIADIAFADQAGLEKVHQLVGDEWEDEFYWLADETIAAYQQAGLKAAFTPVSVCAGVFVIETQ